MTKKIIVGTRASALALKQASEVVSFLKSINKEIEIEILPITTSGDKMQDRQLADFGGKGLFIKELEESLVNGKIDLAIHSAKDVPPLIHDDTEIAAFAKRVDPRDCLISDKFVSIEQMPQGTVVGTSSARRKAFLLHKRPDLNVINFRGNVDTRLTKIAEGKADATLFAVCGLQRLQVTEKIRKIFSVDEIVPAGGQGALIIQTRKNDVAVVDLVSAINHEETAICVGIEREFLRQLFASCHTPVGVYCNIEDGQLQLRVALIAHDGSDIFSAKASAAISVDGARMIVAQLIARIKSEASLLLKKIVC